MKLINYLLVGLISSLFLGLFACKALPFSAKSEMLYIDKDRRGRPFAKDPSVVKYQGKYWMYYSIPPYEDKAGNKVGGLAIGIAQSTDLSNWKKVGELSVGFKNFCSLSFSSHEVLKTNSSTTCVKEPIIF